MDKEFVTYEQSLALKELGFNEECFAFYNGKFLDSTDYNFDDGTSKDIGLCVKVPLKQQVFRWFRENGYMIDICPDFEDGLYYFGICYKHKFLFETDYEYSIYEEAENACIDKLIEIAKQQEK